MPEYHVGQSPLTNTIYAGTLNKRKTMWINKSDVTDEALASVRDHLKQLADEEERNEFGYEWDTKDGKCVQLLVKIMSREENDGRQYSRRTEI